MMKFECHFLKKGYKKHGLQTLVCRVGNLLPTRCGIAKLATRGFKNPPYLANVCFNATGSNATLALLNNISLDFLNIDFKSTQPQLVALTTLA